MLELMTAGGTKPANPLLFHIDMDKQEVGDTRLIDQISGKTLNAITVAVTGQAGYSNSVVDHPTYGRVFAFAGNNYHSAPQALFKPPVGLPANKNLIYEVTFVSPVVGSAIFGTGGFRQGSTWEIGYIIEKATPNYTLTLVRTSSGSSGTSSSVANRTDMHTIRLSTLGGTTGSVVMTNPDATGQSGPYSSRYDLYTAFYLFGEPRAMAGLFPTKGLYGHLKSVKIYVG